VVATIVSYHPMGLVPMEEVKEMNIVVIKNPAYG